MGLVAQEALVVVGLQDEVTGAVLESDTVVHDDAVPPVVDVADIALDPVGGPRLHRRRKGPLLTHPEMSGLVGERDLPEVVAVRAAGDGRGQQAARRRVEFQAAVVVGENSAIDHEGPGAQPLADVGPFPFDWSIISSLPARGSVRVLADDVDVLEGQRHLAAWVRCWPQPIVAADDYAPARSGHNPSPLASTASEPTFCCQ